MYKYKNIIWLKKMLIQDYFQFMDVWSAVELGLYFCVIGYYVLLFAYFGLIKYRKSKKLYWLFFAILPIMLAIGRVFFISYYFFVPEIQDGSPTAGIGALLMIAYRLATFFTWMGITCIVGVLGILLLPVPVEADRKFDENGGIKVSIAKLFNSDKIRRACQLILLIIPVIIGILALTLPDALFMDPDINDYYFAGAIPILGPTISNEIYPIGRFMLNLVALPLLVFLIPIIFIYLAWKTFGVLRKSYALNALGFIFYFAGRLLQGLFETYGLPHMRATIPPLLIILSLLMIVIANNVEQLK